MVKLKCFCIPTQVESTETFIFQFNLDKHLGQILFSVEISLFSLIFLFLLYCISLSLSLCVYISLSPTLCVCLWHSSLLTKTRAKVYFSLSVLLGLLSPSHDSFRSFLLFSSFKKARSSFHASLSLYYLSFFLLSFRWDVMQQMCSRGESARRHFIHTSFARTTCRKWDN